ncbi:MAG: acetate--CoA ligase alpha subunit [Candidatus Aminicenantia bacterium]
MSNLNLKSMVSPKSVAVIGASSRSDSVGMAVFKNILFSGYKGIVYPVNPKAKSILGVRAYPSILDVPDQIDLVVLVVPNTFVTQVIEECGKKGVKGVVIITAGFKEVGEAGAKLEKELVEVARKYGISVIGPNCVGIINTDPEISLNATFARPFVSKAGSIAFVSQSGAFGVAALEYARKRDISLSKFISVGNKADVNENDLLAVLKEDEKTKVILFYLEDLVNPSEFMELAREISEKKPILVIKSGRTMAGAKAASSHTGALAGSDEIYNAFFMQAGVIRVESLEELFDCGIAFSTQPAPKSNKVAIITNAGGPGIVATDAIVKSGAVLANLEERTKEKLSRVLPTTASVENPVDLIGDAKEDRYESAIKYVLEDPSVDGAVIICTPTVFTDLEAIAKTIRDTVPRYGKPVTVSFMGTEDVEKAEKILEEAGIPNYLFPEISAKVMAKLCEYGWWIKRPLTGIRKFEDVEKARVEEVIEKARKEGRNFLPEPESYEILKAYGFPLPPLYFARSIEECISSAEKIGYPLVLKIVSPDILHKVDVEGVKLNIEDTERLTLAFNELMEKVKRNRPDAEMWGVIVQKMIKGGKETILGMKRDRLFGPVLMFGLGGVYVEAMKDVSFRIAPLRELTAKKMIREIKGFKILEGYRGEPPSDIDSIEECLMRLSQLVTDFPDIEELDINPLMVLKKGEGSLVLDARIILKS